MKINRDSIFVWGFWIVVLGVVFYLFSLKDDKPKAVKKENRDTSSDYDYTKQEYDQEFCLWSEKYGVEQDVVRKISIEYMRIFSPLGYEDLLENYENKDTTAMNYYMKPRQTMRVTIRELSFRYNLSKKQVAEILWDFRQSEKLKEIHTFN